MHSATTGCAAGYLGEHRVLGYIPDDGGYFQWGAAAISAQTACKVKAEAVYMILFHPPAYILPVRWNPTSFTRFTAQAKTV